jgi:hypothetical protein
VAIVGALASILKVLPNSGELVVGHALRARLELGPLPVNDLDRIVLENRRLVVVGVLADRWASRSETL